MVRLKHRYLLVNILYPDSDTAITNNTNKPTAKDSQLPNVVSFRRPSSDKLTSQVLARMIRDGVAELFGDYGSGMIASSLMGEMINILHLNNKNN
jgi:ribonuclease P/MRP protein subunit POP5